MSPLSATRCCCWGSLLLSLLWWTMPATAMHLAAGSTSLASLSSSFIGYKHGRYFSGRYCCAFSCDVNQPRSFLFMGKGDGKKKRKKKSPDSVSSTSTAATAASSSPTAQNGNPAPPLPQPVRVSNDINIPIKRQIRYAQMNKAFEKQQSNPGFRQKKIVRTKYRRIMSEDEVEEKKQERKKRGQDPNWDVILNQTKASPLVVRFTFFLLPGTAAFYTINTMLFLTYSLLKYS